MTSPQLRSLQVASLSPPATELAPICVNPQVPNPCIRRAKYTHGIMYLPKSMLIDCVLQGVRQVFHLCVEMADSNKCRI